MTSLTTINLGTIGTLDQKRPYLDNQHIRSRAFALLLTRDEYELLNDVLAGRESAEDYKQEIKGIDLILLDTEETHV